LSESINIKIDEDIKEQAEKFFEELGLNMSSAINIFVRQSLREGRIPFEISLNYDPFFNPVNMAILSERAKDMNEGKGELHELIYEE